MIPGMPRTKGQPSLADRFRLHAEALIRDGRSPLSATLMRAAAADLDASGIVARLFADVASPPRSVPQLRLLAALHHLVLAGRAPGLAAFYPSAGGDRPPGAAWPAAAATIEDHFDWVRDRLRRTVQTNEPGRSTVLYSALLWLVAHFHLPIRLLEIGASAGLNLIPDRYRYDTGSEVVGDVDSRVRFGDPWHPGPAIDLSAAAAELDIRGRAGCDANPLRADDPEDRVTLMSYIWPDELERIERQRAALDIAAEAGLPIEQGAAGDWLDRALRTRPPGELTVVWHSVFRQYVEAAEWEDIEASIRGALGADPERPVVWLAMEPGHDHLTGFALTCVTDAGDEERVLAGCGDHGPPVRWQA